MCGEIDEQVIVGQDMRARLEGPYSGHEFTKPTGRW